MLKVNLLKNRVIVKTKKNTLPGKEATQTSPVEDFNLDTSVDTFEYSQMGQVLKLLLLISFIVPLIFFERIRNNQGKEQVVEKNAEVQVVQNIKIEKEKEVKKYVNLNKKKEVLRLIDLELQEMKDERLIVVQSLDVIQTAIPVDVWLMEVTFSKSILKIKGQTFIDRGLDLFIKNLKREKYFVDINVLKDIKVEKTGGKVLNEFLITLNINKISESVFEES